jgi:glycosyltransferase involved in cell wall biosynthesis
VANHLRLVKSNAEARAPSRLLIVSDAITATQYISFLQPLQPLAEAGRMRLFFEVCPKTAAQSEALFRAIAPDCLILSRCTLPGGEPLVKLARQFGIPYVYHIDDDLMRVPESLGSDKFRAYNHPARLQRLAGLMNDADLVYASTVPLKEALRESAITGRIEAGEIYCAVDPSRLLQPMAATTPVIGYMGTSGHLNDLMMILPTIERLMEAHANLRFELFGTIQAPDSLARFGSRVAAHQPDLNYAGFIAKLHSLGWWIGLAPLEDNAFNRCKADTKWVEYTTAGIAVVASDMPVYHRACEGGGGTLIADGGDWGDAIAALLRDSTLRRQSVERARARLRDGYTAMQLQRQVLAMLAKAAELSGTRN